jgi:hypothetical protein
MDQQASPGLSERQKVAMRVSAAFAALGYRVIQYGGATVEQYTRGGYSTGDVDLGFVDNAPSLETKAKVMQQFGCDRGIRLYEVDGVLVDLGGVAELFSTNTVNIESDEGSILLEPGGLPCGTKPCSRLMAKPNSTPARSHPAKDVPHCLSSSTSATASNSTRNSPAPAARMFPSRIHAATAFRLTGSLTQPCARPYASPGQIPKHSTPPEGPPALPAKSRKA